MSNTNNSINTRLIPLSKWNDHHDYPTVSALRHLVFFEEQNNFSKVLRRLGKRIYIDEKSFFEWVDAQNSSNSPQMLRPSQAGSKRRSTESEPKQ
jgi:hypothetical protein